MFNTEFPMTPVRNPLQDGVFNFCSIEGTANPPPFQNGFWISNLGNFMISNTFAYLMFGGPVPPPADVFWVDNLNDEMITSSGDYIIFGA